MKSLCKWRLIYLFMAGLLLCSCAPNRDIPHAKRGTIDLINWNFKTQGEGTGLGLAIAYEILAQHEGEITLQKAQECARFHIRLPTAQF